MKRDVLIHGKERKGNANGAARNFSQRKGTICFVARNVMMITIIKLIA